MRRAVCRKHFYQLCIALLTSQGRGEICCCCHAVSRYGEVHPNVVYYDYIRKG